MVRGVVIGLSLVALVTLGIVGLFWYQRMQRHRYCSQEFGHGPGPQPLALQALASTYLAAVLTEGQGAQTRVLHGAFAVRLSCGGASSEVLEMVADSGAEAHIICQRRRFGKTRVW